MSTVTDHAALTNATMIACEGEVSITAAANRLSATIWRSGEIFAKVNSADEARAVLERGVSEYELTLGCPSWCYAMTISRMVAAVGAALL
jgi:hypothetical protein